MHSGAGGADWDFVVVGGGVVGLATALSLAARAPDERILVLEKERALGAHASGRNSGVIHSGIYDPPGSKRAAMTKSGGERLFRFCKEKGVRVERTGKLIVARTEEETKRLLQLKAQGVANEVEVDGPLSAHDAGAHEPEVRCREALWVPTAAILDPKQLVEALAREAKSRGCEVRTGVEVRGARRDGDRLSIETPDGALSSSSVVNCAGVHADRLAHRLGAGRRYAVVPFRGDYLELAPRARPLVKGLIYPCKDPLRPFLGVHLTKTVDGEVLVGPNAVLAPGRERYEGVMPRAETLSWIAEPAFVNLILRNRGFQRTALSEFVLSTSPRAMADEARRIVPALGEVDFVRSSHRGIRAQLVERATGAFVNDVVIEEQPGAVHVLNAVSPGMTNCLAFGDLVAEAAMKDWK